MNVNNEPYDDIIKIILINNYFIKHFLNILIKDDNEDKTDYELTYLIKKAQTLLNQNNYFLESKYKIPQYCFLINKFIVNLNKETDNNNNLCELNNSNRYINNFIREQNIFNDIIIDLTQNIPINNNSIRKCLNNNLNSKNYNREDKIDNNKCSLELNVNINEQTINNELKNNNVFLKKKRNIFKITYKTSRYKGVSKNKNNWQAYIRINDRNIYLGTYKSEKIAAKIYDFMIIKKNGSNAKTNFKYTNEQIVKSFNLNIDINNISEIVSKSGI